MNKITKIFILGLIFTLSSGYLLYSSRKLSKNPTYRFSLREQGAIDFLQKLIEETSSKEERKKLKKKKFKEEPLSRDKILRDFLNKVINIINKCTSKKTVSIYSKNNIYKKILTSIAKHMRNQNTAIHSKDGRLSSKKTIAERYSKLFDYVKKLLNVYTQKNVIECLDNILGYFYTNEQRRKIVRKKLENNKYWHKFFEQLLKLIKKFSLYPTTLTLNPEILRTILKEFINQEEKVLFNNKLVKDHLLLLDFYLKTRRTGIPYKTAPDIDFPKILLERSTKETEEDEKNLKKIREKEDMPTYELMSETIE